MHSSPSAPSIEMDYSAHSRNGARSSLPSPDNLHSSRALTPRHSPSDSWGCRRIMSQIISTIHPDGLRPERVSASRIALPMGLILTLAIGLALSVFSIGCAGPAGTGPGLIHRVAAGENLYRISLRYGVDPKQVARINGVRDVTELKIGQRLFIPGVRRKMNTAQRGLANRRPNARTDSEKARRLAQNVARAQTSLRFAWPVRGRLSSRFGMRKGRPHEGIDVAASRGTPIHAAESGRVIHSGRLSGYGKVVIVKHAGAYRTVYAHASKLLVRKGAFVERGQTIALVGSTGRSTGPHVHFEIRRSETPHNPLAFLPRPD
ncbi:MAG TPA: LysM peptidoglycan-binding domain-containing protein [Myxococcales bacterium]|nr:LysM peptidoglycan-binding domain-containing protein [Myxococcales bacterium]